MGCQGIFRESVFSGAFSSPHTFCTPPYRGPIAEALRRPLPTLLASLIGFPKRERDSARTEVVKSLGEDKDALAEIIVVDDGSETPLRGLFKKKFAESHKVATLGQSV